MIKQIENVIIGIVVGAVPVIVCFLAGWWISIPFVPKSHIFLYALLGIFVGILIDIICLRNWVQHAYSTNLGVWMGIYIIYSAGLFGFFMGVPVFHVILALPAGVFVGRWLSHNGMDTSHVVKAARQSAVFTTSVLGLVYIASASIALTDPSTAANLHGMLGLSFTPTREMIIGIILIGGALLLAFGWWLTVKSVKLTFRLGEKSTSPSA